MNVENPTVLWLLLLVPVLGFIYWRRSSQEGLSYSHTPLLEGLPVSLRQQWRWLTPACKLLALAMSIIALSQPYQIVADSTEQQEGIAIATVLDISSSMNIRMDINGERKSRLEVAKRVLNEFMLGNDDDLQGRPSDLISLISFARFPRIVSPLTNSHESLAYMAKDVEPYKDPQLDGTAFGDATALAAAQLSEYEDAYDLQEQVASKILILITDGENNTGDYDPMMAASMAREWGIRIYTIFIGNEPQETVLEGRAETVAVDWVLQAMADQTGGVYQKAHDYDSLTRVYEAIDELETSRLQLLSFQDQEPVFFRYVLLALVFLAIAALLNATWLRRLG